MPRWPSQENKKKLGGAQVRLHALELKLEEAEGDLAHLRGLVAVLRSERERWRQRVLQAASGNVCSRCERTIKPAAAAAPSPDVGKPDAEPVQRVVYIVRDKSRGGRPHTDPAVVTQALSRVADGESTEAVALSLGVSVTSIRSWRRRAALAARAAPEATPAAQEAS